MIPTTATIATITITEAVEACGSTLHPGTYTVSTPADYDADAITGEDILCDGAIVIVEAG